MLIIPTCKSEKRWPNKDRINDLSCHVEQSSTRIEGYDSDKKRKPSLSNNGRLLIDSQQKFWEVIENNFQAPHVQEEDIVMVGLREKKSTGGWRCQLTPWHLRFAVLNSSGNKCAKIIASWTN